MTTATSTTNVLTALRSAGLALTLTPDRGLGVTPKARLTEPLRVLIKAHRDDLVRWLGRCASNDSASSKALEPQPAPAMVTGLVTAKQSKKTAPDWQALDAAYQAHHVNCSTCIAAGKGYGLRCGRGATLWAEYDAADLPARGQVPARVVGKVSPRVHTEAHTVDPLLTDTGNPASAARLAQFDARGLSADEAEALASKLLVRDMEGDRRGACAECLHLSGHGPGRWKCGDRQHGINDLAGANLGAAFVHLNLHHCFSLEKAR